MYFLKRAFFKSLSLCNIKNLHEARNEKCNYYHLQGRSDTRKGGGYIHTPTTISVKGNYMCKSPGPCKELKYVFEFKQVVGAKIIML